MRLKDVAIQPTPMLWTRLSSRDRSFASAASAKAHRDAAACSRCGTIGRPKAEGAKQRATT